MSVKPTTPLLCLPWAWLGHIGLLLVTFLTNQNSIFASPTGDNQSSTGYWSSQPGTVPQNFTFRTSASVKTLCFNRDVYVVVMVCSHAAHFRHRSAIRDTWASVSRDQPSNVHVIFLVGVTTNDSVQIQVDKESSLYKDILQVEVSDSYGNLTLKSVAMLQWMKDKCSAAKYLLKTDDDVYININTLIKDLQNTVHSKFIMGDIIAGAQPFRDNTSKWATPRTVYAPTTYPKYVSGAAYVISGDLIEPLYKATQETRFFWIEDVYITSFCAKKANAKHLFNSKFLNRRSLTDPCSWRTIISTHRVEPDKLRENWAFITDSNTRCSLR